MISVSALRSLMRQGDSVNRLWRATEHSYSEDGSVCRICNKTLRQIRLQIGDAEKFEIDVCRSCQVFWFDNNELEKLPIEDEPVTVPKHSPNASIDMSKPMDLPDDMPAFQGDDESFADFLLAAMGVPVVKQSGILAKIPWLTFSLILLCTTVVVLEGIFGFDNLINKFGFIPSSPLRYCGATFISSAFLHADFFHFVFNIYFLWLSGKFIEQRLSLSKTAMLFFISLFASKLLYAFTAVQPNIPCVGASGFIAGFMGCCAVLFPTDKLSFLVVGKHRIYSLFNYGQLWIELPFWFCFAVWFLAQLLMAFIENETHVAFTSHLGGAAAGVIAGIFFKHPMLFERSGKKTSMTEKFYGEN